jgi:nucleoside 2-deoxyribosyltransferase
MSKKIIYLAGPMTGCTDEEMFGWRNEAKRILGNQFFILDPTDRDYRGKEEENYDQIVLDDLKDIANSDIVLVKFDKVSAGTCMEMVYAWQDGRTNVYVINEKNLVLSPWVLYHSDDVFSDLGAALKYIMGTK